MNAIAKKLLVKPGQTWLLHQAPEDYSQLIAPLPTGVTLQAEPAGKADGVQLFVKNRAELVAGLQAIALALRPDTVLWIMYPKKSSGMASDLEMTGSWKEAGPYGLESVAAASVDATWTALRFKPSALVKASATRNAELPASAHAEYINVSARQVTLPPEVIQALQPHPEQLAYLQSLSYSHKKEYILWILTAKQEKTRQLRLIKLVEMLGERKKNPNDK